MTQLYPSKKCLCPKTLSIPFREKVLLRLFLPTPQWWGLVSSSRLSYPYSLQQKFVCNTFMITSSSPMFPSGHATGVYNLCVFSLGSHLCRAPAVCSPFVFLTVAPFMQSTLAFFYHKMHFKRNTS